VFKEFLMFANEWLYVKKTLNV